MHTTSPYPFSKFEILLVTDRYWWEKKSKLENTLDWPIIMVSNY